VSVEPVAALFVMARSAYLVELARRARV